MKINSISLISLVSVLTIATSANAAVLADFYAGGMVGAGGVTMFTGHTNDTESSAVFGALVGMDLPIFRTEVEYDYFKSSDLDTNAALLNIYAKIPSTVVMPYIGAGVGMIFGGEQTITENGVDTDFNIKTTAAYQAMLGATIDVLKLPLKFDIEGRALYAPDVYTITDTDKKPDMLQYNLRIKVRYIF